MVPLQQQGARRVASAHASVGRNQRAAVARFLGNTFSDDEFGGLQCIFCVFRLMLQYHDPELGAYLDRTGMGPELYASSWFITLMGNSLQF